MEKTESTNVLVTCASRRVALMRYFCLALQGTNSRVIAVDCEKISPAQFFAHQHYIVPMVKDSNYLDVIENLVEKENIKIIIPTIDQELLLWAKAQDRFKALGATVVISPPKTIEVCNDKRNTYDFFCKNKIPFPQTWLKDELTYNMPYPLFIKPRMGRGSVDCYKVSNKRELDFFVDYVSNPVIQEFLQGHEFTVDAYFDRNFKLITAVPRFRMVVRAGVSDRGKTFYNEKINNYISKMGELLQFRGAVNMQGKLFKNEVTFFEINPRFSGGIQLSINAGADIVKMVVDDYKGKKLESKFNNFKKNLIMTSFEESIFLDTSRNVSFFYLEEKNKDIIPTKNRGNL